MGGARGEGIIEGTNGREFRVLYTNRALAEAEQQMGKSVISVAQGFTRGESGITELAHLLRVGIQAARRDAGERSRAVTLIEAYAVLDEVGFTAVATVVMEAVAAVLGYKPRDDEDEETGEKDPN